MVAFLKGLSGSRSSDLLQILHHIFFLGIMDHADATVDSPKKSQSTPAPALSDIKTGLGGNPATIPRYAASRSLTIHEPLNQRNYLVDTSAEISFLPVSRNRNFHRKY